MPDLSGTAKVHGPVAVIDQVGSATGEVTLTLEGGDGGDLMRDSSRFSSRGLARYKRRRDQQMMNRGAKMPG